MRSCDRKTAKELRSSNAPFWRAMRRRYQNSPTFERSLRNLIEVHEYGYTDVGIMFGVSRQRVEQWAKRFGITLRDNGGSTMRVWDAQRGRFVGVGSTRKYRSHKRRLRREANMEERRQGDIKLVQDVAKRLGRAPIWTEVWPTIRDRSGNPQLPAEAERIATRWGYRRGGSRGPAFDALWLAAGFYRPDGRSDRWRYEL